MDNTRIKADLPDKRNINKEEQSIDLTRIDRPHREVRPETSTESLPDTWQSDFMHSRRIRGAYIRIDSTPSRKLLPASEEKSFSITPQKPGEASTFSLRMEVAEQSGAITYASQDLALVLYQRQYEEVAREMTQSFSVAAEIEKSPPNPFTLSETEYVARWDQIAKQGKMAEDLYSAQRLTRDVMGFQLRKEIEDLLSPIAMTLYNEANQNAQQEIEALSRERKQYHSAQQRQEIRLKHVTKIFETVSVTPPDLSRTSDGRFIDPRLQSYSEQWRLAQELREQVQQGESVKHSFIYTLDPIDKPFQRQDVQSDKPSPLSPRSEIKTFDLEATFRTILDESERLLASSDAVTLKYTSLDGHISSTRFVIVAGTGSSEVDVCIALNEKRSLGFAAAALMDIRSIPDQDFTLTYFHKPARVQFFRRSESEDRPYIGRFNLIVVSSDTPNKHLGEVDIRVTPKRGDALQIARNWDRGLYALAFIDTLLNSADASNFTTVSEVDYKRVLHTLKTGQVELSLMQTTIKFETSSRFEKPERIANSDDPYLEKISEQMQTFKDILKGDAQ